MCTPLRSAASSSFISTAAGLIAAGATTAFVRPPTRCHHPPLTPRRSGFDGDPFEILGVGPDATKTELRKAFRKKALKTHPDVNDSPEAAAEFAKIQSAYDTLSDPDRRLSLIHI